MLISLLSMLGGGLMRLLPEILGFLNKKADNAHELAMFDRQLQADAARSQLRINEMEVQGDINTQIAMLGAQSVALKSQMQKTGIKWVDALNFLVRPLTTYYFLGCYGIVKTATLVIAMQHVDKWHAILQCWNDQDAAILSGILAFWFVGRVFEKQR
jgi:hypothetical protein